MQRPPPDLLVLDRWFCHGIGVAADCAGECHLVFPAVRVLPGKVPRGIAIAALPAPLSATCDLGSSPRSANSADQAELGAHSGGGRHGADDPHMEQQRLMDSQLGFELAGMVSGRDVMERSGS